MITKTDVDSIMNSNRKSSPKRHIQVSCGSGEKDPYNGGMSSLSFKPIKLDTSFITTITCDDHLKETDFDTLRIVVAKRKE